MEAELLRIDILDQISDQAICVPNEEMTKRGNDLYFGLLPRIDSLLQSDLLPPFSAKNIRSNFIFLVQDINEKNFNKISYWEARFENIYVAIIAMSEGKLSVALRADAEVSLENFAFYQYEPGAEEFLKSAAYSYPVECLSNYKSYSRRPYAEEVVIIAGRQSPEGLRTYLGTNSPIADIAEESDDPAIDAIVRLFKVFKGKTRAYAMIELIVNDDMPLGLADELSIEDHSFFQHLIAIKEIPDALGAHTVDRELNRLSLKVVRLVNEDHDNTNLSQRFSPVNGYSPEEIYTLCVYTHTEIFTSTFNGFFDRMMDGLGDRSAYEMVDSLNWNQFRIFVKMAAGYNKLEPFLATMTYPERREALEIFASDLEQSSGDLEAAVYVADALGSIEDSITKLIITQTLRSELNRVYMEGNTEGVVIYSLLSGLFLDTAIFDTNWVNKLADSYDIPQIDRVPKPGLFNEDSIHIQWHFFYDDKDGVASFATFRSTFGSGNWKVIDRELFIQIESTRGERVVIFANKPEHEYDGQDAIAALLSDSAWIPQMIVHRGHSYYANLTIEQIPSDAKVVVLGSCGSYHNLSEVLERAPNIHIISSKQIGRMAVNNPLLKSIAETVREGEELYWPGVWEGVEANFEEGSKNYLTFKDYIPPHKNLGAIFIRAYRNIMLSRG